MAAATRAATGTGAAVAPFAQGPVTTEDDAADGFAGFGMFRERRVFHALFDFNIAGLFTGLRRNDFVNVGGHKREAWSVADASCANASGPTGSSGCQGSQAVRVDCFSTTSRR